MIILKITLELIRILQNISRRVVGNVLINISPSTIFLDMISLQRFYQHCQADLAAVTYNGLKTGGGGSQTPVSITSSSLPLISAHLYINYILFVT